MLRSKLTSRDWDILATRHGSTREAREIRSRLADAGLKFCPSCVSLTALDAFAKNGKYKQTRCKLCDWKNRTKPVDYISVASKERTALTRRLYVERHPERVKARDRAAYRARRDAGMTPREAARIE